MSQELLEILRCPACVIDELKLEFYKESWLVCTNCGRKYPILEDIPIMLIDEGSQWINTPVDALPVPPPSK